MSGVQQGVVRREAVGFLTINSIHGGELGQPDTLSHAFPLLHPPPTHTPAPA